MKRLLILILLCINFISSYAQQDSKAIYVYRNDGRFNAFFSEEVDSMRYSKLDLDSIEHKDHVIQEIWTADSIYRIPLAVIDSVSIEAPITKYAERVVHIDESYIPYIKSVSRLQIVFQETMPSSLRPTVGDILLYESSSDLFPYGFAGRISTMQKSNDIVCECDSVCLDDVYENLVVFGEYYLEKDDYKENGSPAKPSRYYLAPKKIEGELPFNLDLPIQIGNDMFSLNGSYHARIGVRVVLEFHRGNEPYFEIGISENQSIRGNFKASIPYAVTMHGIPMLNIKCPIPNVPLVYLSYEAVPFCNISLSGSSEIGFEKNNKEYHAIIFENGTTRKKNLIEVNTGRITSCLGLSGSVWSGVLSKFGVSTIGGFLSATIDLSAGPKLTGDINLDILSGLEEQSWYGALKDSKVSLLYRLEGGVSFNAKINKKKDWTIPLFKFIPGFDWEIKNSYLLPLFTTPDYKLHNNEVILSTTVSRDLLLPGHVGLRLIDQDKNIVSEQCNSFYRTKNEFFHPVQLEAKGLDYSGTYTVSPLFKVLGITFDATPRTKFNLTAHVYTGGTSSVTTNSAYVWGGYSITDNENAKAQSMGFCYSSTTTNPIVENSTTQGVHDDGGKSFSTTFSGLQEETTYYYRAYITLDGKCYYGDVQCFSTKKKNDPNPDPDPNPKPEPPEDQTPPIATTGGNGNIKEHSATITCLYDNIMPGTDCGYFLDADSKGGNSISSQMVSLGCVSGQKTVTLSGLKSGTTYYYQAYARNEAGKSLGEERSFTTKKAPVPTAQTGGCSDITENSAVVSCTFGNVPKYGESFSSGRCGVEIRSNDWSYRRTMATADGTYTKKLSGLMPATTYTYCAFADYDDGTIYGEEKSFTTDMPDLSGTWTFNQTYLGAKTVHMNLVKTSEGNGWVSYHASGFYGVITFDMTVYSNHSASLSLNALNGAHGAFSGTFNDDYTSISGDSYLYVPDNNNWAVSPWTVDAPWSMTR